MKDGLFIITDVISGCLRYLGLGQPDTLEYVIIDKAMTFTSREKAKGAIEIWSQTGRGQTGNWVVAELSDVTQQGELSLNNYDGVSVGYVVASKHSTYLWANYLGQCVNGETRDLQDTRLVIHRTIEAGYGASEVFAKMRGGKPDLHYLIAPVYRAPDRRTLTIK